MLLKMSFVPQEIQIFGPKLKLIETWKIFMLPHTYNSTEVGHRFSFIFPLGQSVIQLATFKILLPR